MASRLTSHLIVYNGSARCTIEMVFVGNLLGLGRPCLQVLNDLVLNLLGNRDAPRIVLDDMVSDVS